MFDLKLIDIFRLNKELGISLKGPLYKIAILSNIITSQLKEILEYSLRSSGIKANVVCGDYDNILQDALKFKEYDLILIFWEAANFIDGFQYKANLMDEESIEGLTSKVASEIESVLSILEYTPLVVINKFSSLIFSHHNIKEDNFDRVCKKLNGYLEGQRKSNVLVIDIEKLLATISIAKSIDLRYYYSSKALYSFEFYKLYAYYIKPIVNSVKGKAKKALVFDCDNTLWKGILGEDGMENIEMSSKSKNGIVFEEVQYLAIGLAKNGIFLGICSKNNLQDIESVISNHPDIVISEEYIAIKKVNWVDKVSNIKEIAKELNIGLDSIIYIDDSDFEIGFVRSQLPEITLLQVPSKLHEYPELIRKYQSLFYSISESDEDLKRTKMYKQQVKRAEGSNQFFNMESYLTSLGLKVIIHIDPSYVISRIAQMTQKTNQFNLTTKRYTEVEIEKFIKSEESIVLAFEVSDMYGNAGVTGLSILKMKGDRAIIDTLLMSCRVLGRNIEIAFFDFLVDYFKGWG